MRLWIALFPEVYRQERVLIPGPEVPGGSTAVKLQEPVNRPWCLQPPRPAHTCCSYSRDMYSPPIARLPVWTPHNKDKSHKGSAVVPSLSTMVSHDVIGRHESYGIPSTFQVARSHGFGCPYWSDTSYTVADAVEAGLRSSSVGTGRNAEIPQDGNQVLREKSRV